jgi:hypothetical protein
MIGQVMSDSTQSTTFQGDIVNRLNYGVVFKQDNSLFLTSEYWLHTFEIQLPRVELIKYNHITCPFKNETCTLLMKMLDHIKSLKDDVAGKVNAHVKLIHELTPYRSRSTFQMGRTKRSLFSFIGDVSKALFGTATMKDLAVLARHVQAIGSQYTKVVNTMSQYESQL